METEFGLLEESSIQLDAFNICAWIKFIIWGTILESRTKTVSPTIFKSNSFSCKNMLIAWELSSHVQPRQLLVLQRVDFLFSSFWFVRNNQQNLFNIFGSMYAAVLFLGINNCSTVLQHVAKERDVMYRERFSGMYSSWVYSLAQVWFSFELNNIIIECENLNMLWNAGHFNSQFWMLNL